MESKDAERKIGGYRRGRALLPSSKTRKQQKAVQAPIALSRSLHPQEQKTLSPTKPQHMFSESLRSSQSQAPADSFTWTAPLSPENKWNQPSPPARVLKTPVPNLSMPPASSKKSSERTAKKNVDVPALQLVEPKVYVPHDTPVGHTPRRVAVERKKRLFARQNMTELLLAEGIDQANEGHNIPSGVGNGALMSQLPLEQFDNLDFDMYTPEEWIENSRDSSDGSVAIPARGQHPSGDMTWLECVVTGYDKEAAKFNVQWQDTRAPSGEGDATSLVSRLSVYFRAEDPFVFAKRIAACHEARKTAESVIRYNLYVDCMPTDEIGYLDSEQINRVISCAMSTPELKQNEFDTSQLLNEVNTDYVRTMNKLIFDANLNNPQNAHVKSSLVLPPPPPPRRVPKLGVITCPAHDFPNQFSSFAFTTFLTKPEVIMLMFRVKEECNRVLPLRIFNVVQKRSMTLEEFHQMQSTFMKTLSRRLKEDWTTKVISSIKGALQGVGKGWYNIVETQRDVYEFSKLRSLLRRVNFMMQDSLRYLVDDSLREYTDFVKRCAEGKVKIRNTARVDMSYEAEVKKKDPTKTWTPEELKRASAMYSMARPPPLLSLEIRVSEEEVELNAKEVAAMAAKIAAWRPPDDDKDMKCPHTPIALLTGRVCVYNTPVVEVVNTLLDLYDKSLPALQSIEQVEHHVMDKLFWSHKPMLASVHAGEKWVRQLRQEIKDTVTAAVAPLHDFLKLFDVHTDFINVNVEELVKSYEHKAVSKATHTIDVRKIKAYVQHHMKERARLESAISPKPVQIGLVSVHAESLRQQLVDKHNEIIQGVLELLQERLKFEGSRILSDFDAIKKVLRRTPQNVEELNELVEYIGEVPTKIGMLADGIGQITTLDSVLSEFRFKLSPDDIKMKWKVIGCPSSTYKQITDTEAMLEVKRVEYMELMHDRQVEFGQTLMALESEVAAFQAYTDLGRCEQVAKHVLTVEKKVLKAEEQGRLFNSREGLFGEDITEYVQLANIRKTFDPYYSLWTTSSKWLREADAWVNGPLEKLDAEAIEKDVSVMVKNINKSFKTFSKWGVDGCVSIANEIKVQIEDFKPQVPLLLALRNPGMRDRHWEELSENLGFQLKPDSKFSLKNAVDMKLGDHLELITKVADKSTKEFQIESAMDNMENEWKNIDLQIIDYRNTGTCVLKGVDDIMAVIDEHVTMTQAMQFSAYKAPFEERINRWDKTLCLASDCLEEWIKVQRNWLYLQPIFESPDINKQLPAEGKRFATVDKNWRQALASAKAHPNAMRCCASEKLLERFQESNKFLDQVQKGLSDYLETKRGVFARFYFLSNDELLSILSETKDVQAVQPHLKKCFEGISRVKFQPDLTITSMTSREGETIQLLEPVDPNGKGVETWMVEVENMMRRSVRNELYNSIVDYTETKRTRWMQKWPGMCVLNGSQLHWTREMEENMEAEGNKGVHNMLEQHKEQLADMVILVRGKLEKNARTTVGALTVIDVHARDVTNKMYREGVSDKYDFQWISQLRYYWDDDMFAEMVKSYRPYGYEYLGNSFRLVITPLTDKCYLTIMGALQMILGGAPAGPAGTGKTETTKDLAKALAKQCVVFNCSDGLDVLAMGKFFKGLASCGAWACFDEFNRINVEVLSVVAQQIITLQAGVRRGDTRIFFENSEIALNAQFAVFITMNPGYAGRTELPDNLKALFRPVAMMVPDYALIGEIMFYASGFDDARICAQKMVTTFKLCSEQLSSQFHYDYGMRAVKTVITTAGNLKRTDPDVNERVLLLRALEDVNLPKFLAPDLPLFRGIISDLFPGLAKPNIDYGELMSALEKSTEELGLMPVEESLKKNLQLYEMIVVRHGLMVVGPPGGGKTENIRVLAKALTLLKEVEETGFAYEKIHPKYLNPKSITMGQLYGEFDPNTHEWQDGILANLYRQCAEDTKPDRKWVVFDGPVDAIWIENMNTVLDDNKKLCLNSGEMLQMSAQMTMMFEVHDLSVASPATISRCGMIYMEPETLGLDPIFQSWLLTLPKVMTPEMKRLLQRLFDIYVDSALKFRGRYLVEAVETTENNGLQSLYRVLDCFLVKYQHREGQDPPTQAELDNLLEALEPLFFFALVWSIGCTTNAVGRKKFDSYLREEMNCHGAKLKFPIEGDVYNWNYDQKEHKWVDWMDLAAPYKHDPKLQFTEMVVPTTDSTRNTFLLNLLLVNGKHTLMVGDTGTGKTVNITQYLMKEAPEKFVPITITFSAQTSANLTQDMLDSKMEKRRKGVYGPVAGKKFIVFVDDLNMPKREKYYAQPPIELLRQWFDYEGWYDRGELTFRRIVDIIFVCAMGIPGGGRNPITPRFKRRFNIIAYTEMATVSKKHIFSTILTYFLEPFDEVVRGIKAQLVNSSVDVYNTICRELLPTPAKSHYTFNLRDLAGVFQGLLMCDYRKVQTVPGMLRLWVHESTRVFADRLINDTDCEWFQSLIKTHIEDSFCVPWKAVQNMDRIIFGDYMVPGAEPRIYDQVADLSQLVSTVEEYLADYNEDTKSPMKLVMFLDAIEHVSRISRIIRQPQGNALCLGVGGSGRQSLTRLAAFMADYEVFQVEIKKGYSNNDWREDIRTCLLKAGLEDKPIVFLFNDTQIVYEGMLEDINNILNSGDLPNLYSAEEMDKIMTACRVDCQRKRLPPTKLNIFGQYLVRVRRNIHVVMCMSPLGDAFRDRLRMFPSLVNCCTIDWFREWPAQALNSVATTLLTETDLGLGEHLDGLVEMFKMVHQSVEMKTAEYWESLRRRNYVTPTSYLELLSTFKTVLQEKRTDVNLLRNRLSNGLDKLSSTKVQVAEMQEELTLLQPQLEKTAVEVANMMVAITKDKADASETKKVVEKEEDVASVKMNQTKAIADDAQRDLDEALPALAEAVECLKTLKKADIDEVKSMRNPPSGVRLTMHAVCIMFALKPVKKNDPDNPGKKIDDYMATAAKNFFQDAKAFMAKMVNFDKDNIPASVIRNIEPFIAMEEFQPKVIEKASQACRAMCMWTRAMHKYHMVALAVEPKKKLLAEAQADLDIVLGTLNDAKARLQGVNDRIAELERKYDEAVAEKEALESKARQCTIRLESAEKLIGGLGGEEARWKVTVGNLETDYINLTGDSVVSAGAISYLGAFTSEFRVSMIESWHENLVSMNIPHTEGCDLETTLADPVQVRSWQIAGLPTDNLSVENGIIMAKARRWPLLIDPQGQANRFIKNLGKESQNGMDVVKLTDKNFLRALENGVRFGKWVLLENIGESLDATLEPILQQQKFKSAGQEMMQIGDSAIPYNDSFRFFMTTKLPNPHYQPEVCVKVSLLNFTITPDGLEEQLLGVVIRMEMPALAEKKNALVLSNAQMRKELQSIENKILFLLSKSEGNILDDTELINTLAVAKKTSADINVKMVESEEIEKEIDISRENYRPVAFRAATLFFCIANLSVVDPMYQYSLTMYTGLFTNSIIESEPNEDLHARIQILNDYFTYALYKNICRSLFEVHKLLFSFLLTISILQSHGQINGQEWRFLISGQSLTSSTMENPDPQWIDKRPWNEVQALSGLPYFAGFDEDFVANIAEWRALFDSVEPHKMPLPGKWDSCLSSLQKMCVLRCLRPDRMTEAIQNYVTEQMGQRFIEPPPFDLPSAFADATVTSPLIFVLSPGSDPLQALRGFAEEMRMGKKLDSISLGQGQGVIAERMIDSAMQKGMWVLLQNCHLCISWMPELERICEEIDPQRVHKDFRLWLTSMPDKHFPVSVLQDGIKMTNEPPKGLRANLKSTYYRLDDEKLSATTKPAEYRKLLFGLSFFHAIIIERKKFGALGWNIPYEFNESDLFICRSQLEMFLDQYEQIPYEVLNILTSYINYGGRVTDDKDLRTIDIILRNYFRPDILNDGYKFSDSGTYYSCASNPESPLESYNAYIDQLPINPDPEVFGMHDNANITCNMNETYELFDTVLSLQPRQSSGGGITREELIGDLAKSIFAEVPEEFNVEAVGMRYPVKYEESMNTVLVQETIRYNNLIAVMRSTLAQIQKALVGLVVMSGELEDMGDSLFNQWVPKLWEAKAYPSLKPLGAWVAEFKERIRFLSDWIENGIPAVFWISGFFFPQAFMTGTLQNYARKYVLPIDTISFAFNMKDESHEELTDRPEDGCYIHGMYIEGARWDKNTRSLEDPLPKELYSEMPVMHLMPEQNREAPQGGIYRCPVYKILSRAGQLSTTGHSTNFVVWIELPSNRETVFRQSLVSETNANVKFADQECWIKAGVACFLSLRY